MVKAVILPNLAFDKMRSLYNITKSSIDLPRKGGGGGSNSGPFKKIYRPRVVCNFPGPPCRCIELPYRVDFVKSAPT